MTPTATPTATSTTVVIVASEASARCRLFGRGVRRRPGRRCRRLRPPRRRQASRCRPAPVRPRRWFGGPAGRGRPTTGPVGRHPRPAASRRRPRAAATAASRAAPPPGRDGAPPASRRRRRAHRAARRRDRRTPGTPTGSSTAPGEGRRSPLWRAPTGCLPESCPAASRAATTLAARPIRADRDGRPRSRPSPSSDDRLERRVGLEPPRARRPGPAPGPKVRRWQRAGARPNPTVVGYSGSSGWRAAS